MQPITKSSSAATGTGISRNLFEDLFRIGAVVRRRWRLIAAINLVFLTMSLFYLVQSKTVYKASARLLLIQQGERPINVGGPNPFGHLPSQQDTLSTHLLVIRSPIIIGRALEQAHLTQLSVDSVINNLKVQLPAGGGKVLDLDYQADSEVQAKSLMEAVIASYDRFLKDNFQKDTRDVMTLIGKARDELSKELKDLERTYLEFRKQHPALTGSSEGRSFAARRLEQWDQAASVALARSLQVRTQVELARKLSREGVGTSVIQAALNQLGGVGVGSATIVPEAASGQVEPPPEDRTLDGGTYEQIADQLADVEYLRHSTERLIEHFRTQQAAMAHEKPPAENEVLDVFFADHDVARRVEELDDARSRHNSTARVARNSGDPAVAAHRGQVKNLENEISQLWHDRKGSIQNRLVDSKADEAIRKSESDLLMLRAREAFLRERAEETRIEQIEKLRGDRARLIQELGAKDQKVVLLDKQINTLETGISDATDRKGRGQTDLLIESLDRSLEGIESMRAEIEKRLAVDINSSHGTEITLLEESNLRSNLERQRSLFDSVAAQLKQAQLVSDYGSVTVQTISPPKVTPSRAGSAAVMVLTLLVGTAFGTGASLLIELFEARIRTVTELRAIVQLPVITLIPEFSIESTPGLTKCGLLCLEAPRSLAAELYKSARTQLELLKRDRRAQVLLLSSPNSGDGKSTTSSNLAISQAFAGRKTLLIDGDLRRPSIHAIYDLARDRGLSQILDQEVPFTQIVQGTHLANLDVATCGPEVSNPAEILASPRLDQFLQEMRSIYDIIIIDSPPLLIVTDPWIISAVADGVILVVKVGEVRRQALEQTMEVLKTLGTPALGVVINGVKRDQFGFANRFNTLYGYGYGYGYGYRPNKSHPPAVPAAQGGILEMAIRTNEIGASAPGSADFDPQATA